MRLNIGQRIGIVMSVLVLIIVPIGVWFNASMQLTKHQVEWMELCLKVSGENYKVRQQCNEEFIGSEGIAFWPYWFEIVQACLVALLVLWVVGYICTYTVRWILAGRNARS